MNQFRFTLSPKAPSTQARDKTLPCKRSCCWTPYGCGHQNKCDCHATPPEPPQYPTLED